MSIQTYVTKLADNIVYRLDHLNRFTDHIFISKESLLKGEKNAIMYVKGTPDTYELCDIIHSHTYKYDWLIMLLLYCPEHEPYRELLLLKIE